MQPATSQQPGAAVPPPPPPPTPSLQPPSAPPPAIGATAGDAIDAVTVEVPTSATGVSASALRARRAELSNQLNSADGRRQELVSQLREAPPGSEAGLVARIEFLDQRIIQLEQAISENSQELANLPITAAEVGGEGSPVGTLENGQITGIAIVFIIFVLAPLAVAFGRLLWKRGSLPRQPAIPPATEQRLERLEQGVDAIAVEVERISEGQRFVTRLLSEAHVPAALPVPDGTQREKEAVERRDG